MCVTSPVVKIFGRILRDGLKSIYGGIEKQSGFSAESSYFDHIFVLKLILEKHRGKGRTKEHICVDLHKSYDTAPKTLLFKVFEIANMMKR